MTDQLDMFAALQARDKGMAQVMEPNLDWASRVVNWAWGLSGWEGMGEDLRHLAEPVCGPPHHSNAWGPMIKQLTTLNIIYPIGFGPPKDVRSHGSWKRVYRSRR
jgi:hypothetical protein